MQSAFVESFNSKLRYECLNEHVFTGLADARQIIVRGGTITIVCVRTQASER
jgi:hypothetical protein